MSVLQFGFDSGMGHVLRGDVDLDGASIKAALCDEIPSTYSSWIADEQVNTGDIRIPSDRNGYRYQAQNSGQTGSSEPTWPSIDDEQVTDNEVTWKATGGDLADNEFWTDISSYEVDEGDGYLSGGVSLGSKEIKSLTDPRQRSWDSSDPVWPGLTKEMFLAALYVDGDTPGTNDYLLSYMILDHNMSPVSVNNVDFRLKWNANGIIRFRQTV